MRLSFLFCLVQKIIRYKCYQTISDVSPEIYFHVGQDIQYRLIWDKYLKGLRVRPCRFDEENVQVIFSEAKEIRDGDKVGIYWQIVMPLFIDNRDV